MRAPRKLYPNERGPDARQFPQHPSPDASKPQNGEPVKPAPPKP